MRIVCDRCRKNVTDFENRKDWKHIELYEKGYGKLDDLHETYKAKNADYGDSFALVRKKYPNAILIRLNDKLNRLETLMNGGKQHVDESIDDTLLDLANYCIMELVERRSDD